ncbi:MAG TPA: heterodisulfide reductase-related iron-sulfur binding cluster [Candidatus Heimdallarchaeota archaeon]|nr:heterodisulfide reductase-related iron-sulfur binding cluster [Candidatus Heimdallarchaeota archaeon]
MIKTIDIFFVLCVLVVFFWGINRHFRLWRTGVKDDRSDRMGYRLKTLLTEGIAHRSILRDPFPGTLHLFIFLGFLIPLLVIFIVQFMFSLPLPLSNIVSLLLDILGFAAFISILLFLYRRYVTRPPRLSNTSDDLAVLLLLLSIILTGFLVEGLRLSVIGKDKQAWAPIGNTIASLWNATGMDNSVKSTLTTLLFRIHFFLVLATIVYIPFSKLFHIISSPLNILYRSLEPKGAVSHMDLEDEEAESFGISRIEEFSWKHLMDLDACTQCGRCQDYCPAHLTEKPLSPKVLIKDLKDHMYLTIPQRLRQKAQTSDNTEIPPLVGKVIAEDVLWACTTCRSCMEHCPVYVEHVDKIVDMRRYQVLMESKFPEELTTAFRGLEKNSNPWGLGFDTRADWVGEMNVPILSESGGKEIDYLFFVGCIRSFDDRNKKVTLAMIKILNHLGVKFAILGLEEGCCGDPARRVGNEYLYQILAQTNIDIFQKYNIKRILTSCPHCYNTFKNEYPQLGFSGEVLHHTTFLWESLKKGQLKLTESRIKTITYHDPCYLGRYSDIFEPPRNILRSLPHMDVREMKRNRADSLCCGAGGGWMWMDEKIGKRINIERLEDALAARCEGVATACPFCVTMFNDAIKDKALENDFQIWDIAELIADSISETD